jgi:hypothetical protein
MRRAGEQEAMDVLYAASPKNAARLAESAAEYKSRILSNVYESAIRLHIDGFMTDHGFNEIAQLCYPDYVLTAIQGDDGIEYG